MEKILFDTDIGSDIDDAVCLAYLLMNPECELLGITTVTGQPVRRAMLASVICQAAGRAELPIYPGEENPFQIPQYQPEAPQASVLDGWPHRTQFPEGQAVEFLKRTIRANPGEITLLTVGPLSNAGRLFQSDPETARLLKGLVSMAGMFTGAEREWNAMGDPHASRVVYSAGVSSHRSIGLDVTRLVTLPSAEVRQRFTAPVLRPVLDFADIWFTQYDHMTFHDPLAAVTIFDPEVCQFTRGRVEIELEHEPDWGMTRWHPDPKGPHQVALHVDPDRFYDHYFSIVCER